MTLANDGLVAEVRRRRNYLRWQPLWLCQICQGGPKKPKYEFTVQGSVIVPKQTSKGALTSKPTSSGGVMAGFRVNRSNCAAEGDYDYLRNSEKFFSSSSLTRIPMNLHAVTVTGIVRLPTFRNIRPFALAGGGLMVFDP